MSAEAAVIVVTYNSADHIRECIDALRDTRVELEIVVADNASDDNTLEVLGKVDSQFALIANESNIGFAMAVNDAVARSTAPFILLLNPDCMISGVSVDTMISRLRDEPTIGILAPTIDHPGGRLSVRSAGYQPTFLRMVVHSLGLARVPVLAKVVRGFNLYPAGETYPETDVEWASGACLLVRRSTWEECGGLSERWFMYAEDIDFCRKVSLAGLRVIQTSEARALHVLGASSDHPGDSVWTLWIENLADYYRHVFRPSRLTYSAWRIATSWTYASRGVLYAIRASTPGRKQTWRREARKFFAYAKAVLHA